MFVTKSVLLSLMLKDFDLLVSSVLLVAFSPLLIVLALLVFLQDFKNLLYAGPGWTAWANIHYVQNRSMVANAMLVVSIPLVLRIHESRLLTTIRRLKLMSCSFQMSSICHSSVKA